MTPVHLPRRAHEENGRPDSWRLLYRVGGVSAWLLVGTLVAAIVLSIATPAPPTAGGTATLDYIAAHRTLYIVHQQLWLLPGLFGMVTYLALYPALKDLGRSLAALGTAVGGSGRPSPCPSRRRPQERPPWCTSATSSRQQPIPPAAPPSRRPPRP